MHEEAKEEQPSNLTAEEEEMLRPRELKVVNPLIHEATHQEFLENVKVRDLIDSIICILGKASSP